MLEFPCLLITKQVISNVAGNVRFLVKNYTLDDLTWYMNQVIKLWLLIVEHVLSPLSCFRTWASGFLVVTQNEDRIHQISQQIIEMLENTPHELVENPQSLTLEVLCSLWIAFEQNC